MLETQRFALETEAGAIHEELSSPGINGEPPAGIKDSLVDVEGFPRGDIDIYAVKSKQKRLAEINTDHKFIWIGSLLLIIKYILSKSTVFTGSRK